MTSPSPFDLYVRAWNAGDLDAWLAAHHFDARYESLAGPEPCSFDGHEGLREVWAESRANWHRFELSVLGDGGNPIEVMFSGMELEQGIELSGVLWFDVESRDGKLARVRSALDAGLL